MDHDHSYKLLFSEPRMVADLLEGFVPEQWVQQLDLSTLERMSGSYVSEDLRDREDDMVWRVRLADSSWLYVYLLLEFQSAPDPYMALRILVYEGLLYQDLLAGHLVGPGERLPPIVPLVLYNGSRSWAAAPDVAELVEPVGGLERFVPHCRYLLVDESRAALDGRAPARNLVAALFELERSRTPADIRRVLDRLVVWLDAPGQEALRRAFAVWLRRVLLPARFPDGRIPEAADLGEVRLMLAERVIEWTQEWKAEGLAQGRAEGRAEILSRQLQLRFGAVPPDVIARLRELSPERLDALAERVLTAASLEEVFGP